MRNRERQAWTEFVEQRESEKKAKRPRAKKPEVPQAQLEAALDDVVNGGTVDKTSPRRELAPDWHRTSKYWG